MENQLLLQVISIFRIIFGWITNKDDEEKKYPTAITNGISYLGNLTSSTLMLKYIFVCDFLEAWTKRILREVCAIEKLFDYKEMCFLLLLERFVYCGNSR